MSSTVVYTPPGEHHCNPGWETRCTEDGTRYAHDVGSSDPPGTVRRCGCGRYWVAVKPPEVRSGMQECLVRWRLEKPRERRRRERAAREARMAPPSSNGPLRAPPPTASQSVTRGGCSSGGRTAAELPTPPASVTRPKTGGYSGLRPASEVPLSDVAGGAVLSEADELATLRAENARLRR